MSYITVHITVTSEVTFADGRTDPGPSTHLQSEMPHTDTGVAFSVLLQKTVNDLHRTTFPATIRSILSRLFSAFGDPARMRLSVNYTVGYRVVGHYDDGQDASHSGSLRRQDPVGSANSLI